MVGSIVGILLLAAVVEALVEYLLVPAVKPNSLEQPVPIVNKPANEGMDWRGLVLRYSAAIIGVALCIVYGADLLALIGMESIHPVIGQIITGVLVGRGANFVNDFADRWLAPAKRLV